MTTYKLSWQQLDKLVFKYLDKVLADLKYRYEDISLNNFYETWTLPNSDNHTFALSNHGTLYISENLISLVSKLFSVDSDSAIKSIKRWCIKRLNIKTAVLKQSIITP